MVTLRRIIELIACLSGARTLGLAVLATFGLTTLIPVQSTAGRGEVANENTKKIDYFAAASRVTIRVKGSAELTGDYRVGPDQAISLPVIGRVHLPGKDGTALESELARRISAISKKEAFVTVEIAAYRPIFVTGAVRNSGAVEWQPQMTVLQAVVLAGGPERLMAPILLGGQASPMTRGKSVDGQKRDLSTLARLRAARANATEIQPPKQLIDLVGAQEAAQLIAAETETLRAEGNSFLEKQRIIAQSIVAEKQQITSLRAQLELTKQQIEARKLHLLNMKGLKSKGLVTSDRVLEQEIRLSDLLEKVVNVEVGIAKGIGTLAALELSQVTLTRDRQGFLTEEIGKMDRVSTHTDMDLQATRGQASVVSDAAEGTIQYEVVSMNGQAVHSSLTTPLLPGDVLIVTRR